MSDADDVTVSHICQSMMLKLNASLESIGDDMKAYNAALPDGRMLEVAVIVYSMEGDEAVTLSASAAPWGLLAKAMLDAADTMRERQTTRQRWKQ